ncbi:DNA-binding response regulator [Prevotella sp. P5-126]|uniref:Response regulator transcription factor n=1 Tax=Xylanibacter brevis TaxID=83231 RepID=A0ABS9CFJ1_9BACT|nr:MULTISPECIES: response regulator transcription factor [Prevotellaceae]MCF2558482.1 response regulator transcription factor [Xylanibacter brevis]MCF2562701.1 response regulator transcription factor [Xylanibacter brevis]OYP38663.1 DNA-binding response regulator [Prevotella sp. P5-126]OYP46102.1 DNA-binding response regulator [Prevotella sp. P4-98]
MKEDNKTYKILVVDDEQNLCEILAYNLRNDGYEVTEANSAEEALELPLAAFDLMLLDVMMGGMSGFDLARRLKTEEKTAHIPIIFLTAKDTEQDMLHGFGLGADDYIAKPFRIMEVLARVKAVLNRSTHSTQVSPETLRYDHLVLNLNTKTVSVDGEEVAFTKTEFELLRLLLEHKGRVFSRQELIDHVWPSDVMVLDRTVDVNITRMRKKIGRYAPCISTRLGYGYYFNP